MSRFEGGYFKLWRKVLSSDIGRNPNRLALLVHLIGMANIDESWAERAHGPEAVERGSLVTSVAELCQRTGLQTSALRRQLVYLEKRQTIEVKSDKRGTLITFCNFKRYQDRIFESDKPTTNEPTNRRQTDGQTDGQYNEELKNKRSKEGRVRTLLPSEQEIYQSLPIITRDLLQARYEPEFIREAMTELVTYHSADPAAPNWQPTKWGKLLTSWLIEKKRREEENAKQPNVDTFSGVAGV